MYFKTWFDAKLEEEMQGQKMGIAHLEVVYDLSMFLQPTQKFMYDFGKKKFVWLIGELLSSVIFKLAQTQKI